MLLLETLEKIDRDLFLFFNGHHSAFFDRVFWIASLVLTWIPLYVFFAVLVIKKFGPRCWVPLLGAGLLVLATDQGSVLIKNSVARSRPTHNAEIGQQVHTINGDRGGNFGFVSSHAANMWGLAAYLILLLRPKKNFFSFLLLLWAAFVSYGRIYAGVHYPSDVAGGALLGIALAFIIYRLQQMVLLRYFNFQSR